MLNTKSYSRKKELLLSVTVFIFLAGSIVITLFEPVHFSFYPPCLFKKMTGFNCAGCGSARALHKLMHGDVSTAIDYNILTIGFLPVIFIGLVNFFTGKLNKAWIVVNKPLLFLIMIAVFWILRNLPFYPFYILNADR